MNDDSSARDLVYYGDEDYHGVSICKISHVAHRKGAVATCVNKAADEVEKMGQRPDIAKLDEICAEHLFLFQAAGTACGCRTSHSKPTELCHLAVERLNEHIPVVAPNRHMPFLRA